MRISDWSSDVCSSDLLLEPLGPDADDEAEQAECDRGQQQEGDHRHRMRDMQRYEQRGGREEDQHEHHRFGCRRADEAHHHLERRENGRAHVCTSVTTAHLVCGLMLEERRRHPTYTACHPTQPILLYNHQLSLPTYR